MRDANATSGCRFRGWRGSWGARGFASWGGEKKSRTRLSFSCCQRRDLVFGPAGVNKKKKGVKIINNRKKRAAVGTRHPIPCLILVTGGVGIDLIFAFDLIQPGLEPKLLILILIFLMWFNRYAWRMLIYYRSQVSRQLSCTKACQWWQVAILCDWSE